MRKCVAQLVLDMKYYLLFACIMLLSVTVARQRPLDLAHILRSLLLHRKAVVCTHDFLERVPNSMLSYVSGENEDDRLTGRKVFAYTLLKTNHRVRCPSFKLPQFNHHPCLLLHLGLKPTLFAHGLAVLSGIFLFERYGLLSISPIVS